MADITPQKTSEGGITNVAFASAAGGGDTMNFSESLMVLVKNDSAGSITVTCEQQVSGSIEDENFGAMTKANASIAVAAGNIGVFGPFKHYAFRDSSGKINLAYSGVTSLGIAGIYS